MSNKAMFFITLLTRETSLNYKGAEDLVKRIPIGVLDEAIKIYKEYGYVELIDYIERCVSVVKLGGCNV